MIVDHDLDINIEFLEALEQSQEIVYQQQHTMSPETIEFLKLLGIHDIQW